jgi:hypothetical protein
MPGHVRHGSGNDSRSPDRIAVRKNGRVTLVRLDEVD